jgi:hypothetical protein
VAQAMGGGVGNSHDCDFCGGVYIDDTGVLAVVPWAEMNKQNVCKRMADKIDAAYSSEGLPVSTSKNITNDPVAQIWGGTIDGREGTLQISAQRRQILAWLTVCALSRPITGRVLASLLGNWSCMFQYRRPAYSIFSDVYTSQSNMGLDRIVVLDSNCRTELLVAACLAPMLVVNLRAPIHADIYMLLMPPLKQVVLPLPLYLPACVCHYMTWPSLAVPMLG